MDNKLFLIFIAFTLLSCSREIAPEQQVPGNPSQESHPGVLMDTGFTATLPGGGTKTSVDIRTGIITWDTGDPVLISNGSDQMTASVHEGGSTYAALYSTETAVTGTDFYAIFPSEGASYVSGEFIAVIPTEQEYAPGSFGSRCFPMVSICDQNRNFSFRNAGALLQIVPSGQTLEGGEVTSVTVMADQALAGTISVVYTDPQDVPLVNCSLDNHGENRMVVNMTSGNVPLGEPIYAVIAPGTYTNLKVRIALSSGLSFLYSYPGTLKVDRSRYASIPVPVKYTDLSEVESSNCYVIRKEGAYRFRANVKGNGVVTSCGLAAITEGIASVHTYHKDGQTFLDNIRYVDGYIYFTTLTGELPVGTALVSALDAAGNTLWSWHLWCNPEVDDVTLSDSRTWMNMNLGAHQIGFNPAGYNGYYYQWGRKDPFLQKYVLGANASDIAPFVSHSSKSDGSLENSIAHPEIFYGGYKENNVDINDWSTFDDDEKVYDWWNGNITGDAQVDRPASKTMFDPCPPGYVVPAKQDIDALLALMNKNDNQENVRVVEDKLYFPYTSYRYISLKKEWWPGNSTTEDPRIFITSSTPAETGARNKRTIYRLYMTSGPSQGITAGPRSYGLTVRCLKDPNAPAPPAVVDVTSVQLSQHEISVTVNMSVQLYATVLPANATDPTVYWTSSNPEIATVSGRGVVVGVTEGTAVITAKAGDYSDTCTVTVKPKDPDSETVTIEDMDPDYFD